MTHTAGTAHTVAAVQMWVGYISRDEQHTLTSPRKTLPCTSRVSKQFMLQNEVIDWRCSSTQVLLTNVETPAKGSQSNKVLVAIGQINGACKIHLSRLILAESTLRN